MATLSRGQTFGSSETITNTKLHNLVDLGSLTDIVNADISASANIADTKLADITSGGKVRGTALLNLASIPSGAGQIPRANLSLASIPAITFAHLASVPTSQGFFNYQTLVSSLASGALVSYGGGSNLVPTTTIQASQFINLASVPTNQGFFNYQTLVSSLASGALVGYGGGNNLVPAGGGFKLISTNTGTNVNTTGRIALEVNKVYFVQAHIVASDVNASNLGITFYNSGSELTGASDYAWAKETINFNTTPSSTVTGDDADSKFPLGAIAQEGSDGHIRFNMWIETYQTDLGGGVYYPARIRLEGYLRNNSSVNQSIEMTGVVIGNYTINGFGIQETGGGVTTVVDYTVRVYEIAQT